MPASISVAPLAPAEKAEWRSFANSHPRSTPFHTLAWRDALTAAFDYEPRLLVCRRDGAVVATVPTYAVRDGLRTRLLNPFCEYGFPLVSADTETPSVVAALGDRAGPRTTLALKDADWSGVVGYSDAGFGGVETGTARRLAVGDDPDRLRERLDSSLLGNVDHARESGLSVRTVDPDEYVDTLHELHVQTVRRLGSPQFPRRFFAALTSSFGDSLRLTLAEFEGEAVGALLAFDWRETRFLWVNGSDSDHWERRPNDLLYTETVLDAAAGGLSLVDFGRSEPGSGVDRFKSQFGGEPAPLTTLVAPPSHAGAVDVSGMRRLAPLTQRLAPILTHPAVGPRLKEWIHE